MTELRVFCLEIAASIPAAMYWTLLAVFGLGTSILLWWKGIKEGVRGSARLLLAEWCLLVLAIAVIYREPSAGRIINLVPLWSYFDYGENSYLMEMAALNILNVALFMPIGFLLRCGFKEMTWQRVLLLGMAFSVSIELLQLIFKKGLCEVDDVIHNVLGCMIGYGVANVIKKLTIDN